MKKKKRIVIGNYFNVDCDVDTTIREAYELGFDRGMQKVFPVIRRDVLKQVLEIIDEEIEDSKTDSDNRLLIGVRLHNVKGAVLDLKGGEE